MNNRVRVFLFTHYWWMIALVVVVGILGIAVGSRPDNVTGNIITLCAGALGVVYFIQKQKIEEVQLFERLFNRFNERYAELHDDLQRVIADGSADGAANRQVLDNYFNLCAEEYLFYQQGRILPVVWRAWCRGMRVYLECSLIREYWEREMTHDSHYGLTTEIIREGAGHPATSGLAANRNPGSTASPQSPPG